MKLTTDHHRFYDHYLRLGPGRPGSRYVADLGLAEEWAHRIAEDLTLLCWMRANTEMGGVWIGDID